MRQNILRSCLDFACSVSVGVRAGQTDSWHGPFTCRSPGSIVLTYSRLPARQASAVRSIAARCAEATPFWHVHNLCRCGVCSSAECAVRAARVSRQSMRYLLCAQQHRCDCHAAGQAGDQRRIKCDRVVHGIIVMIASVALACDLMHDWMSMCA